MSLCSSLSGAIGRFHLTLWVAKHVRGHRQAGTRHEREKGVSTDFPKNGDNSALCGLGMLFGSLGEVHDGCTNAIATTKSWELAPARLKTGCVK